MLVGRILGFSIIPPRFLDGESFWLGGISVFLLFCPGFLMGSRFDWADSRFFHYSAQVSWWEVGLIGRNIDFFFFPPSFHDGKSFWLGGFSIFSLFRPVFVMGSRLIGRNLDFFFIPPRFFDGKSLRVRKTSQLLIQSLEYKSNLLKSNKIYSNLF